MNGSFVFPSSSSLQPRAIEKSPRESIDKGINIKEIVYTIQLAGLNIKAYNMAIMEIMNIDLPMVFNLSIYIFTLIFF
jgi:hypothetical protein